MNPNFNSYETPKKQNSTVRVNQPASKKKFFTRVDYETLKNNGVDGLSLIPSLCRKLEFESPGKKPKPTINCSDEEFHEELAKQETPSNKEISARVEDQVAILIKEVNNQNWQMVYNKNCQITVGDKSTSQTVEFAKFVEKFENIRELETTIKSGNARVKGIVTLSGKVEGVMRMVFEVNNCMKLKSITVELEN